MFDGLRITEQVSDIAIGNVVSAFEHLNVCLRLMAEKSSPPDPRLPIGSLFRRDHDAGPFGGFEVMPHEAVPLGFLAVKFRLRLRGVCLCCRDQNSNQSCCEFPGRVACGVGHGILSFACEEFAVSKQECVGIQTVSLQGLQENQSIAYWDLEFGTKYHSAELRHGRFRSRVRLAGA